MIVDTSMAVHILILYELKTKHEIDLLSIYDHIEVYNMS